MTREEAIKHLENLKVSYPHADISEWVDMAIEALQTERPTGVWDFNTDESNGKSWNICSNCGHSQFHRTNYCPNCGAVMLVPVRHVELKKGFKIDDIPRKGGDSE